MIRGDNVMLKNPYNHIGSLLASSKLEELRQGLELVRREISKVGSTEAKPLLEMVSTIFYIDPLDQPDMVPILDEAVSLVVGFGEWIIPILLKELDTADLKAQLAISHALGRIGADAIEPLMTEYQESSDPKCRVFILYAMGKIKSPKIVQVAQLALEAARSPDLELQDTAIRAIGKFVESIPPPDLSDDLKAAFIDTLRNNLADPMPKIRAKAIRSFGKLAKYGHLNSTERDNLKALCQLLLGVDENFDWDRAYIVRREAQEALEYT